MRVIQYLETLKNEALTNIYENPDNSDEIKKAYIKRITNYYEGLNYQFDEKINNYIADACKLCIMEIEKF